MLDVAPTELLLVAVVALVVIGPKDLPKAMRVAGKWIGRARGVARQFRSGIDTMIRESELEELQKQWAAENERIMREHPPEQALPQPYLSPEQQALNEQPGEPVLVEQPEIKDGLATPVEAESSAAAPVSEPAPAPIALDKGVSLEDSIPPSILEPAQPAAEPEPDAPKAKAQS
jgi:sec-independent protein translocase protein TatB